jgi:rhodanese-related sulfurtransferase
MKTIIMIVTVLLFTGCATGKVDSIAGDDLLHQQKAKNPPTVVDVRSSAEYESGHIPDAIHMPWWSVFYRHCDIPSDYDEPFIVYCENGPRSKAAKFGLWMMGYRKIFYLEGDLSAWKRDNLPIEK